MIWLIWAVQKCPRRPECFFIRSPDGASPRKQEMYAPSTRWDQEHSQCEVIHTSTPDVLIKGDLRKWFPQVFLLISTSDGIKKGERGTRSRGVRHLTITLTVMTNFCYIRWLHGWFTSLHQCIPSLNCIHYVHSILKSQLPARKKFHFSQCYIKPSSPNAKELEILRGRAELLIQNSSWTKAWMLHTYLHDTEAAISGKAHSFTIKANNNGLLWIRLQEGWWELREIGDNVHRHWQHPRFPISWLTAAPATWPKPIPYTLDKSPSTWVC